MTPEEIRLECLKLALHEYNRDEALIAAQWYADFCANGAISDEALKEIEAFRASTMLPASSPDVTAIDTTGKPLLLQNTMLL